MRIGIKLFLVGMLGINAGISAGLSVNVAVASCKQSIKQSQTVNCGNINAPLTINTSGGGNVFFGPTNCYITAGQSASQNAICTAQAA